MEQALSSPQCFPLTAADTAWAGSMVWGCSVVLAQYIFDTHSTSQLQRKRVIELG